MMPGLLKRFQAVFNAVHPPRSWFRRTSNQLPTVFHITHYKAGSQWIHRIFQTLAYERLVLPEDSHDQYLCRPVVPGAIYPTLYLTREQFETVPVPEDSRRFVVIRDLRDTLISGYFSLKMTHELSPSVQHLRAILNSLSKEEGLLHLMGPWLLNIAQLQWSWLAAGEELLHYEDLLSSDEEILERVLIGHCGLQVTKQRLRDAVVAHRFENQTKGRIRGLEDRNSHERKGIAGDWRNHFSEKLIKHFKWRYGSVLIATGYEKNFNW